MKWRPTLCAFRAVVTVAVLAIESLVFLGVQVKDR
jgi:hypothetical protein